MKIISKKDVENEIAQHENQLAEIERTLININEDDEEGLAITEQNLLWTRAIIKGLKTIILDYDFIN